MTRTDTNNTEEMKRYLFHELSETERDALEERFFEDDTLFYELVELENNLVDQYARGELASNDRTRFERSLPKSPERREKVANAAALQKFIAEEKQTVAAPVAIVSEEKQSIWQSISNFFSFRMPVLQMATTAMTLLLMVGVGFLLYERTRIGQELARARNEQNERFTTFRQQETSLQEQIIQARQREQDLQNQINTERGQSDILDSQLEREQSEKLRLERELERLRREKGNLPPVQPKSNQPFSPTIATIFLAPSGKGGGIKTVKVNKNTSKISITLQIPKESQAETYSVKLEGVSVAENLKPRATKSGNKVITVSIPAQQLTPDKENLLTVTGDDQSRFNYVFRVQK